MSFASIWILVVCVTVVPKGSYAIATQIISGKLNQVSVRLRPLVWKCFWHTALYKVLSPALILLLGQVSCRVSCWGGFTTTGICMVHLGKSSQHDRNVCNSAGGWDTKLPERAFHPRLIMLKRKMTINRTENYPRSYRDFWNRGVSKNKKNTRIFSGWEKTGAGKQGGRCDPARRGPTAPWALPGPGSTAPPWASPAAASACPHPAEGYPRTCTLGMWGHLLGAVTHPWAGSQGTQVS